MKGDKAETGVVAPDGNGENLENLEKSSGEEKSLKKGKAKGTKKDRTEIAIPVFGIYGLFR